jgi:CBS-domain-containing membrane protein
MLVRDVMTESVVTVTPATSIKDALGLLDQHGFSMLPVVSPTRTVVGVVSEADLIRDAVLPDVLHHLRTSTPEVRVPPPHAIGEVMNPRPVTVTATTDLVDAVDLMTMTVIKSLPVVDDAQVLVGVVSRHDVVHMLARADAEVEAAIDDLFRRSGLDWVVSVRDGQATVSGPVDSSDAARAATLAGTVPGVVGVTVR